MKTLFLLVIIIFTSLQIQEIPINIVKSNHINPLEKYFHFKNLNQGVQYLVKSFLPKVQPDDSLPIEKFNYTGYLFTGEVMIGTPGQKFNMMFDTGSPALWVTGKACSRKLCNNKNKYDSDQSSTYNFASYFFSTMYAAGPVSGDLGQDTFNLAGKQIANVKFGIARSVRGNELFFSQMDGVVGLGIPSPFDDSGDLLLQDGYKQGVWDDNSFSVYINKQLDQPGSKLIIGGVDMKYAKTQFHYYPRIGAYWQIHTKGLKINGKIGELGNVIVDTGAPPGFMSYKVFAFVTQQLGIDQNAVENLSCSIANSLPPIEILIGEQTYSIENDTYITREIQSDGNMTCKLAFNQGPGLAGEYSWLLGYEFQRKYYTHYDRGNNRVGLAESQQTVKN